MTQNSFMQQQTYMMKISFLKKTQNDVILSNKGYTKEKYATIVTNK